jgi:hypothetical protein
MASAFVIMPFGGDFDLIYTDFIKATLEATGYKVRRADDLDNHRAILKDIIAGISTADLVVADLTESNANVYYELGISHAFEKRVILLTQDVDELPFDIRGYRVIQYDVHFARIHEARLKLEETARGALDGRVRFGNPVSDHGGAEAPATQREPATAKKSIEAPGDEEGEKGLFDHIVGLEESLTRLTQLMNTTNEDTNETVVQMKAATELLLAESKHGGPNTTRNQREVLAQLGTELQKYADSLEETNARYSGELGTLQESLEFILTTEQISPEGETKREELRAALRLNETAIEGARASAQGLIEIIRATPSLEKRFNQAKQNVVRALRRYSDNLELTGAISARATNLRKADPAARH